YQLETTPAHMRYGVFAQNQIWYDMVNQLVQQRQAQPQPWSELFTLFGLETLAPLGVEVQSLSLSF
ncbi:MAG: DUF928 domain-containing protein, partial [Leptolyngbyaceae bacterium]|nr:DUF928 domain-containing protein [Leptolyngbyaceae bacterium]